MVGLILMLVLQADAAERTTRITILHDGKGVACAKIRVETKSGNTIASGATDDEGDFVCPLKDEYRFVRVLVEALGNNISHNEPWEDQAPENIRIPIERRPMRFIED